VVIALDPVTGEPVKDEFGVPLPPLATSNNLCLAAVEDVNGDGSINFNGTGDEDGDGLTDLFESCDLGTDPCLADTDGDGIDDGTEVAWGTDPLSPDSLPANVTLNNATTPAGNVLLAQEGGQVGIPLSTLGGSLTADVAWIGKGGVPGSEFGCDTTPADLTLTPLAVPYGESVNGKIALIERGGCFFAEKVALAESYGAVGVIIYNNAGDSVFGMAVPAGWAIPFGIPAVSVGQTDGEAMAGLREAGDPEPLSATMNEFSP
jgi:hypothetical protein